MRRAQQADKTNRRFGKTLQILPVTGEVVTHHDDRVKMIQVQRLAQLINRRTHNGAVLAFPQASNVGGPVINNRDAPAQGSTKSDQWLGILSGAENKNLAWS